MHSSVLNRPQREQQVMKMMKTDQMGTEEGRGKVSGIFHLSTGGEEQAMTVAY